MVITLSGKNDYELHIAKRKLLSDFKQAYGDLSLHQLDMGEHEFNDLLEAVMAMPFLATENLVVVSGLAEQKVIHDEVIQLIDKIPDSTTLIIVEPKLDKRTALYKVLSTKTDYREFFKRDENDLVKWLIDSAKQHQLDLGVPLAQHIVRRVGEDQWVLASELEKLVSLEGPLSREVIDEVTVSHPRETIFQLLEAIAGSKPGEAHKIYTSLIKSNTEPQYILSMIIWQLHNMSVIKAADGKTENQIAKDFKMSPYVVGKTRPIVKSVSQKQLTNMLKTVIETDLALKSSPVNSELAVEQLIFKLSS